MGKDYSLKMGSRSDGDHAKGLPEYIPGQGAASQNHLRTVGLGNTASDLKNPNVRCAAGQSDIRGHQNIGAPFVKAGNKSQPPNLAAAPFGEIWQAPACRRIIGGLHVSDGGGEIKRSWIGIVRRIDLSRNLSSG